MSLRRHAPVVAGLAMLGLVPSARLQAQEAGAAAARPVACTYATCGLRVQRNFWSVRLVRGAGEEAVEKKLTGGGGGVELLLAGPDTAAIHARQYVRNVRRSTGFGLISVIGYGVALWRTNNFQRGEDLGTVEVVALGTAIVTGITGVVYAHRASEDLSRSVWWYNASLPR